MYVQILLVCNKSARAAAKRAPEALVQIKRVAAYEYGSCGGFIRAALLHALLKVPAPRASASARVVQESAA